MTVFVAHAQPDDEVAASLAKAIERRGNFVELEQAERIGRPLLNNDILVLLWSQKMLFEPGRLVLERRALDAWADQKLVVVILDRTMLPVGLRDLPVIDATFDQRRTFAWEEAAAKVRETIFRAPAPAPAQASASAPSRAAPAPPATRTRAPARQGKSGGLGGTLALVLLLLVAAGVWQMIAAQSFTLPIAEGVTIPPWGLLAFSGLWVVVALAIGLMTRRRPGSARAAGQGAAGDKTANRAGDPGFEPPAPATSRAVFVSYAHADGPAVEPVVQAVKHEGREVWMDNSAIQAGEGWAGEIVRAIRGAHGVMVMCSSQAFQSDHVKREVYLADRYKKPMLPVFIEPAQLPEDFEYFFAGVQWLELHKTPEGERAAAIARAVASV